jgi:glycosyltransferase involved in cell wall biosynthesis
MSLRIAVVTSYFPTSAQPYRGHSAYHTLRRMEKFAKIRVFCPVIRYPDWFPPRRFPHYRVDLRYKTQGLDAEYFEYPAVPLLSRPFNPAVCRSRLAWRIAAFAPDVILNYFVYPEGCAAADLGVKLKIPIVLGVIGSDVNRIPDLVTRWHTQRALRRASAVIAVSGQLGQQAARLGVPAQRIATIPNGCDLETFHPGDQFAARERLGIPPDAELILFVGWMIPTKGVHELFRAFAELSQTRPALTIAFVGEGALLAEVRAQALATNLAGRVLTPGTLTSSQVAEWMAAADVFCLPSYAEGCPNVVIEALASGRPVVASRVGAIPEMVDDRSGILIPPRDSRSLAEALNHALAEKWDHSYIATKWNRSWMSVAEETLAVCSQAVHNGVN